MRSSKSRSRSKSNRQRTIGNIINRVFDSSGPEGKVRGTPQQIIDKYLMLARDAQLSNDRVAEQNFLQHAEHYTRMLGEAQREMAREQEARQQSQGQQHQGQYGQGQQGQQNGHGQQGGNGHGHGQPQPGGHPARDRAEPRHSDDQPDLATDTADLPPVIEAAGEDRSNLVETPESRPARPRREPRQPRGERPKDGARHAQAATADNDAPVPAAAPAAVEPAPAQPAAEADVPAAAKPAKSGDKPAAPRSRSPRKPRGEAKPAQPAPGEAPAVE